jgi:diguanylate cyclase (GGDEF)-like protein
VVVERVLQQARQLSRCDYARIEMLPDDGNPALAFELRGSSSMRECVPLGWETLGPAAVHVLPYGTKSFTSQQMLVAAELDDCVVAVLHGDGQPVGVLVVGDRLGETGTFDDGDGRLLEILANHASVALENGRLIDQLHSSVREIAFQAKHDSLTGLANRVGFTDAVDEALAERRPDEAIAVLLMDLDRFKEINDTLGHYAGDQLLIEIGQRLASFTVDGAVVARLGGDEFAMMVPRLRSEEEALGVARGLRSRLVEVATLGSFTVDVGVSIGVALAPDNGDDLVTLLQRADVAMYDAKRSRSGIEAYRPDRDDHSVYRLSLANSLRNAIANQELTVHYQPKADLRSGRIIGVEALVRWNHPEHGLIPPDDFVHVAEQSGLITELTDFVLDAALAQCEAWRLAGHDLTVAVNVSPFNLIDSSFGKRVEHRLVQHRVAPDRLVLEITESGMLELQQVLALLDQLSSMGIALSVDDFGTGYSSLSYLHALPVAEVKIDRSFVIPMAAGKGDVGVVRAIVDLGHNLGLRVVAEGVEDRFTWDELAKLGCDLVQGWFICRALPADELTPWLDAWDPSVVAPWPPLALATPGWESKPAGRVASPGTTAEPEDSRDDDRSFRLDHQRGR